MIPEGQAGRDVEDGNVTDALRMDDDTVVWYINRDCASRVDRRARDAVTAQLQEVRSDQPRGSDRNEPTDLPHTISGSLRLLGKIWPEVIPIGGPNIAKYSSRQRTSTASPSMWRTVRLTQPQLFWISELTSPIDLISTEAG